MSDFISWITTQAHAIFVGNQLIYALIIFVVLDYVTGICVAIHSCRLSSRTGIKGITKKLAVFVVIALCHVLDVHLINSEAALTSVSTFFYLTNEGISILENVSCLGVPLPDKVTQLLSYLKSSDEEAVREEFLMNKKGDEMDETENNQKLSGQ